MNEKECQYDRIYEKTIDFDRTQFVREIQMQINDNKKKDKEIERLNNKINRAIDYIKEEGTTYLNLANQRKWCSEFSAENILKILGGDE